MSLSEFFYYTLLKHGKIIIIILGIIVAILVYVDMQKFGVGFKETTTNSMKYCEEDSDCFEYCGDCVSVKRNIVCEPNTTIKCVCRNHICEIA
ncbi:MAG: hypothetical protein J7K73_01890 [Nanoarchaeota archaeon]|nr:hypothetical protein [Nanoarchaeota archaeon]